MANTTHRHTFYRVLAYSTLGIVAACSGDQGGAGTDSGGQTSAPENNGSSSTTDPSSAGSGGAAGNAAAGGGAAGSNPGTAGAGVVTTEDLDALLASGCAADTQSAELTPANLLFVFDRSGSMNCNPPEGDADLNAQCAITPVKADESLPSKWEVTREALSAALADLTGRPNLKAGISVFPGPEPEDCSSVDNVNAEPSLPLELLDGAQLSAINDFMASVVPAGRTPLAGATILSYQYLQQQIAAGTLQGNTFVVLLTDGEETCSADALAELIDTHVASATVHGLNIRTFVIGAPGSEGARASLSQMAFEGRTATTAACTHDPAEPNLGDCHFDTTSSTDFASDLSAALEAITSDRQLACVFDTPSAGQAVDLAAVNVTFTPSGGEHEAVLQDNTDCASAANGWQYIRNFSQIQLCGGVCERVQNDPQGEVSIILGCPTALR